MRLLVVGTLIVAILLLPSLAADARAESCTPFNGTFVAAFDSDVPGPPYPPGYTVHCPTSTLFPVRQCTHGQLFDEQGQLVALYEFGFTSQTPSADGTVLFTGVSTITLLGDGSVIHAQDHGYLAPAPELNGQVARFQTTVLPYQRCTAPGRCKALRTEADTPGNPHDVSIIVAGPNGTGSLNLVEGTSSGPYIGQICHKP